MTATETHTPAEPVASAPDNPPRVFDIAHNAPLSGWFYGSFAVRGPDGPATLRGPFEEIACAVRRSPESTVYRFAAIADNWKSFARVTEAASMVVDVPWVERTGPELEFAPHPSTLAKIMDLVPQCIPDGTGDRLSETTRDRIAATAAAHIFRSLLDGDSHYVEAWAEVPSFAPVVFWTLIPRRRDAQAVGSMRFAWPWHSEERNFGFAAIDPVRVALVTAVDPNDAEAKAIANSANARIWEGVPNNWGGDLLMQEIVRGTPRIAALVAEEELLYPAPGWDWGGRDNPNATGVDRSFGSTFTAPIWRHNGKAEPRALAMLRLTSTKYGLRPCHWSEPGVSSILRVVPQRALTMHKGQPYERAEADLLRIGTQYRGENAGLGTYDHEHRSVAPLAVHALLTGDWASHYIADSYLAAECYERSVANGWVQPGRGQGLPWIAGKLLQRITNDTHLDLAWEAHNQKRHAQYVGARLVGPDIITGGLYTRGSPWVEGGVEQPYDDPYEQGMIVLALLLNGWTTDAYKHGKGLIAGVWWDEQGRAHGAYNRRWKDGRWPHAIAIGQPVNDDLAKSGDALGMWVGAGLRAFLVAANRLSMLGLPPVAVVEQALRDMDPVLDTLPDGELLAAAHRSMFGTVIAPVDGGR